MLHHLSHYVSGNMDSGVDTIGLFIDVSKAFDSLTHTILLDKLHAYGFRGLAHAWITSYLTDRFQYISNGGCMSFLKLLTTGVPRALYWAHFCFCFMLMTYQIFQIWLKLCCMLMILLA